MFVFDQIFLDREYRCLDGLSSVRTIIDAGANVGYSSAYLLSKFSLARVVCIEPDQGNFALLQSNLAPFGARAELVLGALWSEPTMLSLDASTADIGLEWGRQVCEGTEGTVRAFDIPTLMRDFSIDHLDLLKIDIEGAEQQVFSAPDLSWLDHVSNIVIELHGQVCERTFLAAVGDRFDVTSCDELTVCLSRSG